MHATPQPTTAHTGTNAHVESPEEFAHHVRRYLFVFYALIAGTIITVLASYIPWGNREVNIGVALAIAVTKASLVACYFMHLISERKMIYGVLGCTAFFFVGLMFITLWAFGDFPRHTILH